MIDKTTDLADFGAGRALLEHLDSIGVLEDSFELKTEASSFLCENANTADRYHYNRYPILWDNFYAIYTDFDRYPDRKDIFNALGIPFEVFVPAQGAKQTVNDNMTKALGRIITYFKSNNPQARDMAKFQNRKREYSDKFKDAQSNRFTDKDYNAFDDLMQNPPSSNDIFPGTRNRKTPATRITTQINSKDLVPGEFYSDFSRIPKTRWAAWWKFWDREKTSIAKNDPFMRRQWKKTFAIGYQMEKNLTYEIWYNSIDATFTVHDYVGVQVGRRYDTMSEAIKQMMTAVAQTSSSDHQFFTSMSNPIAQSISRTLMNTLDPHFDRLASIEAAEHKKYTDSVKKAAAEQRLADRKSRHAKTARVQMVKQVVGNIRNTGRMAADEASEFGLDASIKAYGAAQAGFDRVKKITIRVGNIIADKLIKAYNEEQMNAAEFAKEFAEAMNTKWTSQTEQQAAERAVKNNDMELYVRQVKAQHEKNKQEEKRRQLDMFESLGANFDEYQYLLENAEALDNIEEFITDETMSNSYRQQIDQLRREADSNMTQSMIKNSVNAELISTYKSTRSEDGWSNFDKLFWRFVNKGRREPIVFPNDMNRITLATKVGDALGRVFGRRFRADFIIGFSLSDRINYEIWRVTEPNPDRNLKDYSDEQTKADSISTFYVFDVSSAKLIRKYIPYYRNAVQLVMSKLSSI